MIQWQLKQFSELTVPELYAIMQIRQEVFVVEQNCVFIDADGKDEYCYHLSGFFDGQLVVYARIVPPGIAYTEISLGRIVSLPKFRKHGFGRQLMVKVLNLAKQIYGGAPIKIEAQLYLKAFYESYGFISQGDPYILDGILHIAMLRG